MKIKKILISGFIALSLTLTGCGSNSGTPSDDQIIDGNNIPVIKIKGQNPLDLNVGDKYLEDGATASDKEDGDITANIKTKSNVDTSKVGNYAVVYTVTDSDNNSVSATRVVNVHAVGVDSPPTLILNGLNPMTLTLGDKFVDPGAVAVDREDGDITPKIKVSGNVDTSKVGKYSLIYTVKDSAGNVVSETRTIYVNPTPTDAPPTLTLQGSNPLNITVGNKFIDPGATAADREDGDLTSKIKITGTVDTTKVGTYTLTYTVKDSGNNTVTKTRDVVVNPVGKDVPPTLTIQGSNPLTLIVGDKYVEGWSNCCR